MAYDGEEGSDPDRFLFESDGEEDAEEVVEDVTPWRQHPNMYSCRRDWRAPVSGGGTLSAHSARALSSRRSVRRTGGGTPILR